MPANPAVVRRIASRAVATFVLVITTSTWGQTNTAQLMPPHSIVPPTPDGKSIGAWTVDWWTWALSVPVPNDAHTDQTGVNANNGQPDGSVFLLGQAFDQDVERTFTVPAGKYLLAPVLGAACSESFEGAVCATEEGCRQCAADLISYVDSVYFSVNGSDGWNYFQYREASPKLYSIDIVKGNPWSFPPINTGNTFADGYWIMIAPLGEGERLDLVYGGVVAGGAFRYLVTAHITAVPVDCNANGYLD